MASDVAAPNHDSEERCPWPSGRPDGPAEGSRHLGVRLPKGSSNSTDNGRANTSAFLQLAGICPIGYGPAERCYFPQPVGRNDIRYVVCRPQDAPLLVARGHADVFIAFEDVVREAEAAGVRGLECLMELPFAQVDHVVVVREDAPVVSLGGLLASARPPVRFVSEFPFLTRKMLYEHPLYRQRFGSEPPLVEVHGTAVTTGSEDVRITWCAGSAEPHVTTGVYNAARVVSSTGRTIQNCKLKVVKTAGTYRPGLFGRVGVATNPSLAATLAWFMARLELACRRWDEMARRKQLRLPFESV